MEENKGFYEKKVKRALDIVCSLFAIVCFCWLYLLIALIVRIKMGSPVIFRQPRPGIKDAKTGRETIFFMYKFRTMTDKTDKEGKLLPDNQRLTVFGKMLRSTSLDELPEVFNILKGDMSIVGPRPQLVRDMVFMTEEQRHRHDVKPGLTGLAQVMGRNAISWEEKFKWDLQYIKDIGLANDIKIVCLTIKQVFFRKNITAGSAEIDLTDDYGDYLLKMGKVSTKEYSELQNNAKKLLDGLNKK